MIKWLALLLMLPAGMASAAHSCIGKVTAVDISGPEGVSVTVPGIGSENRLCSLTQASGQYIPEACRAVLASLLSAQATGKTVRLYFLNDTNPSCSKGDFKNFSAPEFGWYYLRVEN